MESVLINDVDIGPEKPIFVRGAEDFGGEACGPFTGVCCERRTILLVEDETFVREVACEVLRSAGYKVLTAKNAEEAEKTYNAEEAAIDLLLTDVVMPGESGRSLAARLRAANPLLKVLLATGYGEQMAVRGEALGECLAKPFSTGELLRRVKESVDEPELAVIS